MKDTNKYIYINEYFLLSKNVKFTIGYNRDLICDFFNMKYEIVPHDLYEFVQSNEGVVKIKDMFSNYNLEDHLVIVEYLDFLLTNGYVFLSNKRKDEVFFSEISEEFEVPYKISNCIYEIVEDKLLDNRVIQFGISSFTILYSNKNPSIIFLEELLKQFNNSRVTCLEIHLNYLSILKNDDLINLFQLQKRLFRLIVHSAPEDKIQKVSNNGESIFYVKSLLNSKLCGNISPFYFTVNYNLYNESKKFNTCLNCKIAINEFGEIKNCLNTKKSFGNINKVNSLEQLYKTKIKELWSIKKEEIVVCKDCEFRNICTDCRAFLEDPNDKYSKPLKCGYNPYINEWEDWTNNPLKQKSIDYYGMRELLNSSNA